MERGIVGVYHVRSDPDTLPMTEKYELSRRKALAGLATIGAAGAGAGLGTSAFFSDQESFEGNVIEAGSFSMGAHLLSGAVDQDGGPDEGDWYAETTDEEGAVMGHRLDINDLKPGDSYTFCWCVSIWDNPGVVRYYVDNLVSETGAEAGNVDAADIHDIESNDEFVGIAEHEDISATQQLFICDQDDLEDAPQDADEISLEPEEGLKEATQYDTFGDWLSSAQGGSPPGDVGTPVGIHDGGGYREGSQRQTDYVVIGANEDNEKLERADQAAVALCVGIDVSEDVGNELQGAEMSFDFELRAEQDRHNTNPFDLEGRPHVDEVDWENGPFPVDQQTDWV